MTRLELSLVASAVAALVACSQTERNFAPPRTDADARTPSNGMLATDSGTLSDSGAGGLEISCGDDDDCDDGNPCNGEESCNDDQRCSQGAQLEDGTTCSPNSEELMICLRGSCVPSECGDGQLAPNEVEDCDDGNNVAGDGCEPDCTFTCTKDKHCDDGNPCNGAESCDVDTHTCVGGDALADKTSCGEDRICSAGRCVPEGCGNGTREEGEECDDGNLEDGDGCDSDCTFSCKTDSDCSDGNVCTGTETCDTDTHTCVPGEPLDCDDGDPCTRDECDWETGCWNPLIDEDNDGHADEALGSCGDDCDDNDPTVYAGAAELCDNKDNNCNGAIDETAPTWYRDCDGDGYAEASAIKVQQCAEPGPAPGCDSGLAATWTTIAPGPGTTDCWDKDPKVRPMTADENVTAWNSGAITGRATEYDFDYNCDGDEEPRYTEQNVPATATCSGYAPPIFPITYTAADLELQSRTPVAPNDSGIELLEPELQQITIALLCLGTAGWVGSAPACGKPATFSRCARLDGVCTRTQGSRTQECR